MQKTRIPPHIQARTTSILHDGCTMLADFAAALPLAQPATRIRPSTADARWSVDDMKKLNSGAAAKPAGAVAERANASRPGRGGLWSIGRRIALPGLAVLSAVLVAACATPADHGAGSASTAATVEAPANVQMQPVQVYLVPLDDFDGVQANTLAAQMAAEFGMEIRASAPLSARRALPFSGTRQFPAEDLLHVTLPALEHLPGRGSQTSYVLLTARDINARARNNRFLFSWHVPDQRVSIVSTARLQPAGAMTAQTRALTATRLKKMTRRAIGEMQLGWQRSAQRDNPMYAPLNSVADIDRLADRQPQ